MPQGSSAVRPTNGLYLYLYLLLLEKCVVSAVPRPPFEGFPEIPHLSLAVHTV